MQDKVVLLGDFIVCNGEKYYGNLVEQRHLEETNKEPYLTTRVYITQAVLA